MTASPRLNKAMAIAAALIVAAVFALFPVVVTDPTATSIAVFTLVFMVATAAWNIFSGYSGYLALGHAVGLPMWFAHRLWLGALLALAAYGIVRLLDALSDRPRGALHVVAAAVYVVNPYVAVYADRTTVALLAYAALPWMLLIVHRGLRAPRSWLWRGS